MNFAQLKSRVIALCTLEGFADVSPAPNWDGLVNDALSEFSWEAEYVVDTVTLSLIANTAIYTLDGPPAWKRITDAVYGSDSRLILADENQMRRWNPNWITTPASTPMFFWMPGDSQIQFYPTPSAAATVTLRGFRADGPLRAETDTPRCPAHYHEGIALLAARKHCKAYATGDALARVTGYGQEAKAVMDSMALYQAEQEAPSFQRRVKRSAPERAPLGWNTPTR